MIDKELLEQLKQKVFHGVSDAITSNGHASIRPIHPTKKHLDNLIDRVKKMKGEEFEFLTLTLRYVERTVIIDLLEFLNKQ